MSSTTVANDALRVQLVLSSLGRNAKTRGLSRPKVSSCSFVITLHGCAGGAEERRILEEALRRVPGVRGLVNKMKIAQTR